MVSERKSNKANQRSSYIICILLLQGPNVKTSIPGNVTTGWQMVLYGSPGTGYIPGTFKTEWQPDPDVTDRK